MAKDNRNSGEDFQRLQSRHRTQDLVRVFPERTSKAIENSGVVIDD